MRLLSVNLSVAKIDICLEVFLPKKLVNENYCQKSTYQQLKHNGGSCQENISTESILDMDICQKMYHDHLFPSIIYARFFVLVIPSLLQDSIPHIN